MQESCFCVGLLFLMCIVMYRLESDPGWTFLLSDGTFVILLSEDCYLACRKARKYVKWVGGGEGGEAKVYL